MDDLAFRAYDAVGQEGRNGRVAEGDHLAGDRIHLGMGGERMAQLAAKGVLAFRVQAGQRHAVRRRGFHQRVEGLVVIDYGRVGGVLHQAFGRRRDALDEVAHRRHALPDPGALGPLLAQALGVDEAVAVGRPSVVELDGMDHAVAVEDVIGRRIGHIDRIRTDAEEVAVQVGRDLADHLDALGGGLVAHRRVVAAQEGIEDFGGLGLRRHARTSRMNGPGGRKIQPACY